MRMFLEGHAFFTAAAVVWLFLSIVCRLAAGVTLKRLIAEAENMSASGNRFLKQCKLKFQNYYELNGGVMNVGVFVDRALRGLRVGRMRLRTLDLLSGQCLLLAVFSCGAGACLGIAGGETLRQVLPYYLLACLTLYLHFSVSGLIDVPGRRQELQTVMTDFLENRMTERIRSVRRDSGYLEAEEERAAGGQAEPDGKKNELEILLEEFLA